jgi:hypothetical protein
MSRKRLSQVVLLGINARPVTFSPFTRQGHVFNLDEAIALSVLSLPKRDDVPIIQAPHRRRNYQI